MPAQGQLFILKDVKGDAWMLMARCLLQINARSQQEHLLHRAVQRFDSAVSKSNVHCVQQHSDKRSQFSAYLRKLEAELTWARVLECTSASEVNAFREFTFSVPGSDI
jgi:hypothetical protein